MWKLHHKVPYDLRLKIYDSRNFRETPEMLGIDSEYPAGNSEDKFWQFFWKFTNQLWNIPEENLFYLIL